MSPTHGVIMMGTIGVVTLSLTLGGIVLRAGKIIGTLEHLVSMFTEFKKERDADRLTMTEMDRKVTIMWGRVFEDTSSMPKIVPRIRKSDA